MVYRPIKRYSMKQTFGVKNGGDLDGRRWIIVRVVGVYFGQEAENMIPLTRINGGLKQNNRVYCFH
jgi:hypothetical protein